MNVTAQQESRYVETVELETKGSAQEFAVIVAPPWPRSGAARVIKNEIDYYHSRGFGTALVIVPFHRWFMEGNPVWEEVIGGFRELGAQNLFIAPLDQRRYNSAKYATTLRHAFRATIIDWEFAMAKSARLREDIVQFVKSARVSLLHVNYAQTLGFASGLRAKMESNEKIPIILETHDVQAHLLTERNEPNPWTHKPDSVRRLVKSEISLLKRADALVHLSVDEYGFFEKELPRKAHFLALPAIEDRFVSEVRTGSSLSVPIDLLFIGQKHFPNLEAVQWFLEKVWPILEKKRLDLKIVGPVDELVKERAPRLFEAFSPCFAGQVEALGPYYNAARCVIAPMVSGSGTSIKTIEALALGKPFVGTSKAFRGMPIEKIHAAGLGSYDNPVEFANAVIAGLADQQHASAVSVAAYKGVFSIEANFASRDQALHSVMPDRIS